MSDVFGWLMVMCILLAPLGLIAFIILLCMKRKEKKIVGIITLCLVGAIIPLALLGTFTDPATWCEHQWETTETVDATCTEKGHTKKHCSLCEKETTEYTDTLGHSMKEVTISNATCTENGSVIKKCSRCGYEEKTETNALGHSMKETKYIEPTITSEGKKVFRCERCNYEEIEVLQKIPTSYVVGVEFEEIYKAYRENELRADDNYKNNRYRITAKVSGIESDGLANISGGATLTMQTKIDNTIVFFYASFEKEQEESLKKINVGDTITFEGECISAGTWVDCSIIV